MEHVRFAVVGLGVLGSAAAYHLARSGAQVIGFEQFDLGHVRGASHDTSRIIRRCYDLPEYVKLADSAYRDWAEFERVSGERLVTRTGGVMFCPPGGPIPVADYARSLEAIGIDFELLSATEMRGRFPQFALDAGVETIYTADSGIVHASRSVAALQMQARAHGADLRDRCPVRAISYRGGDVVLDTATGQVSADAVILCTDAWTNKLLAPLDTAVPLQTMQEQVTYFKPQPALQFEQGQFPVWIWEDHVCFYGFPFFGESTIKAARDVSNVAMDVDDRSFVHSGPRLEELAGFMRKTIPGAGSPLRTVTCQYALTPDRHFVLGPVPGHPQLLLALGAGHAFKFAPTIGRVLAELALSGRTDEDVSLFQADRAALAIGAGPASTQVGQHI